MGCAVGFVEIWRPRALEARYRHSDVEVWSGGGVLEECWRSAGGALEAHYRRGDVEYASKTSGGLEADRRCSDVEAWSSGGALWAL